MSTEAAEKAWNTLHEEGSDTVFETISSLMGFYVRAPLHCVVSIAARLRVLTHNDPRCLLLCGASYFADEERAAHRQPA